MITVTRILRFCAAHRVVGHENKCAHLHGHEYTVYITCTAAALDPVGRVIDFSCIKELVGGWIDETWDHGTLLNNQDLPLLKFCVDNRQKMFLFANANPTAENIATFLFMVANNRLHHRGVKVTKVLVFETPNCFASYSDPNDDKPADLGEDPSEQSTF